jgi:hypothetical protein
VKFVLAVLSCLGDGSRPITATSILLLQDHHMHVFGALVGVV